MISVLPRHIPLRGVSHCCHGCLQYTAISPDTHTRSGRLHSSHPPRSSPARLPAALHLAIRSGVLGRCPLHHHPHSHPGETREKRPQEPPSTHTTRGTPGFLPGSPPGDKPGFVSSPGFSQGYGKCGFLVFSRVALSGVGKQGEKQGTRVFPLRKSGCALLFSVLSRIEIEAADGRGKI